jgi:hypothetical protein
MQRRLALSLASVSLFAAAHAAGPSGGSHAAAAALLQRHLNAFLQNDLDAVVADYAHDTVLVTPDAVYEGPERIRVFFRGFMQQFPKGASSLALDRTSFHGDLVYFTWHGKTPTLEVPFATDTMVLRGGRIAQQTFGGVLQPVRP